LQTSGLSGGKSRAANLPQRPAGMTLVKGFASTSLAVKNFLLYAGYARYYDDNLPNGSTR